MPKTKVKKTKLKKIRDTLELTGRAFAKKLKVPYHSYVGYERGLYLPLANRQTTILTNLDKMGIPFKKGDFKILTKE